MVSALLEDRSMSSELSSWRKGWLGDSKDTYNILGDPAGDLDSEYPQKNNSINNEQWGSGMVQKQLIGD